MFFIRLPPELLPVLGPLIQAPPTTANVTVTWGSWAICSSKSTAIMSNCCNFPIDGAAGILKAMLNTENTKGYFYWGGVIKILFGIVPKDKFTTCLKTCGTVSGTFKGCKKGVSLVLKIFATSLKKDWFAMLCYFFEIFIGKRGSNCWTMRRLDYINTERTHRVD